MEFQKRGSLHYHFILYAPHDLSSEEFHEIIDAWLRITGEADDIYAFLHGCQLSRVNDIRAVKNYESKYMGKHGRQNAKAYEKVAPAWFTNSGRWWGVVGGALQAAFESFRVHTIEEWYTLKRLLRSYVRSVTRGRYTPRTVAGWHGLTVLGHGGDLEAFRELVRWFTMQRQSVTGGVA
jgi:hypothetical protein